MKYINKEKNLTENDLLVIGEKNSPTPTKFRDKLEEIKYPQNCLYVQCHVRSSS